MGLTSKVEKISPATARLYLSLNTNNRKLRPGHVNALAGAIRRGEWQLTHQGIAFSVNGELLDGQHRLEAVAAAGVPVEMVVTRDVPEAAFVALDQGNRRSTADALGAEARTVEVATLACVLATGVTKVTPQQAAAWIALLGAEHERLTAHCPAMAKYFSSAGVRLAAVISILRGERREYVHRIYRALVLCHLDELPPVGKSLVQQVVTNVAGGKAASGRAVSIDGLGRGLTVFCEAKADQKRILIKESAATILSAREALCKLQGGAA